jgi:hypothetical protein
MKNPPTPAGIETATFRIVVQLQLRGPNGVSKKALPPEQERIRNYNVTMRRARATILQRKKIVITYSECAFLVLVFQYIMRMGPHYTIICLLSGCTISTPTVS